MCVCVCHKKKKKPVLARWYNAAWMPAKALSPAVMSHTETPTRPGPPPSDPVTEHSPVSACTNISYDFFWLYTPLDPYPWRGRGGGEGGGRKQKKKNGGSRRREEKEEGEIKKSLFYPKQLKKKICATKIKKRTYFITFCPILIVIHYTHSDTHWHSDTHTIHTHTVTHTFTTALGHVSL